MVFMVFICHGQPVLTNRVRTQWTDSREPSDPKSLADKGWTSLADATGADWAKWWKRQLSALESWKCHRWKQHLVVDAVFSLSWQQQFGCDMWTPYWNKPCSVLMCSTWYLNSWWLEHNMYELLGEKKQWQNGREMISWCSTKKYRNPIKSTMPLWSKCRYHSQEVTKLHTGSAILARSPAKQFKGSPYFFENRGNVVWLSFKHQWFRWGKMGKAWFECFHRRSLKNAGKELAKMRAELSVSGGRSPTPSFGDFFHAAW